MQFQLRVYRARPGELGDFVSEWTEHVLPLRLQFGFSVLGPWIAEDEDLFVWILGHDGDWAAEDARYYASDERRAIDPDPARHLAETRHTLMRAPAPAPARQP